MKTILILFALVGLFLYYEDDIRSSTFSALRTHTDTKQAEGKVDNSFYCADGFDLQRLPTTVENIVHISLGEMNRFMGQKNMYHLGTNESRCKILGVTNLAEPRLAETRSDGSIALDLPKMVAYCKREYSSGDYNNCFSAIVKHELLHLITGDGHASKDDVAIMSPTPSSFIFTHADEQYCRAHSICRSYRTR